MVETKFCADEISQWLVTKLSEILEVDPAELKIDVPLEDYGISSFGAVTLSGELEEWLQIELSPTLLWECPTIEILSQFLANAVSACENKKNNENILPLTEVEAEAHLSEKAEPVRLTSRPEKVTLSAETELTKKWIMPLNRVSNPALKLFCFPYAGAGASAFRKWLPLLPGEVQVNAIQLPGRETRYAELPLTELPIIVKQLGEAILPILDTNFVFFGHCVGSLVAFELARFLERNYNLAPDHLLVSALPAPQTANETPRIHTLPQPEFLEEIKKLGGTSEVFFQDSELLELYLPPLRADFAFFENYHYLPAKPLNSAITAIGGLQDPRVLPGEMLGWRQQTGKSFDLQTLPGDHFFLNTHTETVLEIVSTVLKKHY